MRRTTQEVNGDRLIKLIPDLKELKAGDYRKSSSGGFMDLHLDILERTPEYIRLSLAHNGKQNGDNMADPDMELKFYLKLGVNYVESQTYQNDYVGVYQQVYVNENQYRPKLRKELNSFLSSWLKNIKNQGHSLKAV